MDSPSRRLRQASEPSATPSGLGDCPHGDDPELEPGSGTPGTGNQGDLVLVTITADQTSVAENVKPTFTVHINTALANDLVVTLSNNAQVTIKAGQTSAPYEHAAQGDDVYKDAGEISLG
ncbi:hypothetical protein OO257_28085, partial [Pseudomonas sp. DCB_PUT]|nr:hypothetical protein [Pseudomonas sp. DCB_PUT]